MLALREILSQWFRRHIQAPSLAFGVELGVKEEASVVNIIKDKQPLDLAFVAQPVMHQLEDTGF